MSDWSVRKVDGLWRIYDRGCWHDSCDTLPEAHTLATQFAVSQVLFSEGGLSCLRLLQSCTAEFLADRILADVGFKQG